MSKPFKVWKERARAAEARVMELEYQIAAWATRLHKAYVECSRPAVMGDIAQEMREDLPLQYCPHWIGFGRLPLAACEICSPEKPLP
jgi:hypothetical protein